MNQGLILFAHGSRDPKWRLPIEAVARRIAQRAPGLPVRCAYLELTEPDLPAAAAELAGLGLDQVAVVPLFLGVGRHVREDLPVLVEGLRQSHPGTQWRLQPPVSEDESLLDLLAVVALNALESPR